MALVGIQGHSRPADGLAVEQLSDPIALGGGCHGLALGVNIVRAGAVFKQQHDDPMLFLLGHIRPRVALARILDGKVKWGRATPVHQERVGTIVDKGADTARASIPDGSMQRGYSTPVECVGVRSGIDEKSDQLALRSCIRAWAPICGVVERFGSSSVALANGGTLFDQ